MALDGAFLHHLKHEIETYAIDARVDKIYQPNKEEMILVLRTRTDRFNLLISSRANSARIQFTHDIPENPLQPPMLCMLLRKRLQGARLLRVEQPGLERMVQLVFDAVNELGDHVELRLAVEIMGRYSNIIFIDEQGKIIDALKRVDAEMSSERLVLPGLIYHLPPAQDKLCLLTASTEDIIKKIQELPKRYSLDKAILYSIQGISPIVSREIHQLVGRGTEIDAKNMTENQTDRLCFFLNRLREVILTTSGTPYMIVKPNGQPMDFSFLPIIQYGNSAIIKQQDNFSSLLENFYGERDRIERMRVREQNLLKTLTTVSDRLTRKVGHQKQELSNCAERDFLRICGDLLSSNLYCLKKGVSEVSLENFYDESGKFIKIPLDPALSPNQNAQKYYKAYRKAKTAEEKLTEQIQHAQKELEYLDTVFEELARAETEKDLNEIRQELSEQGYLRIAKGKKQRPDSFSKPMHFYTSDGFQVLVGRNNRQNDHLTLKQAAKNDIWFHTKNIPGSHTILVTNGQEPSDTAILEAASLAAFHSRGKNSSKVSVDYTRARYVSKPQGSKPGMVIYVKYKTILVTPSEPSSEPKNQ